MKVFKIIGKDHQCHWINLKAVIFMEFNDEVNEIIFDGIMSIAVEERDYVNIRKKLFKEMFN